MVKNIIHDPIMLAQKSKPATVLDIPVANDLNDTLRANTDRCVGMAANMIGCAKRIIVFSDNGKISEMFNPEIVSAKDKFETEEGCLSLTGIRKTTRYKTVTVKFQNRQFKNCLKTYTGWTAQIIQHEIDHCNGILI